MPSSKLFFRTCGKLYRALQTGQPLRYIADEIAEKTADEIDSYPGQADRHMQEMKAILDAEELSYGNDRVSFGGGIMHRPAVFSFQPLALPPTRDLFHPDRTHDAARVLGVYEWLRPIMPQPVPAVGRHATRLRDILEQFDALFLDGYGVLNVGADMVPEADMMLAAAAAAGVEIIVVTNGASKKSTVTAARYRNLGLKIMNHQVVSSRDALEARLQHPDTGFRRLGVIDSFSSLPTLPGGGLILTLMIRRQARSAVDTIGFSGATRWNEDWQACLEDGRHQYSRSGRQSTDVYMRTD